MLSATNSPLVAGGGVESNMKMQYVKVIRSFNFEGKSPAKDSVIELPHSFAVEMRSANKVEFVDPPKPPELAKEELKPEPKSEAETKPESKAAKPRKGD